MKDSAHGEQRMVQEIKNGAVELAGIDSNYRSEVAFTECHNQDILVLEYKNKIKSSEVRKMTQLFPKEKLQEVKNRLKQGSVSE